MRGRVWRGGSVCAVACLLALAASAASTAQVDPYYSRLLEEGEAALDRHDLEAARGDLRVAAFGLMESPAILARALALLAMAHEEAEEPALSTQALRRIILLEERFDAYSRMELSEGRRAQFESLLMRRIPEPELVAHEVFAELLEEHRWQQLQALPVKERRAELTQLEAQDNDNLAWSLALAEIDIGEGRRKQARDRLESIVDKYPFSVEARCMRLEVNASLKDCVAVRQDLGVCMLRPVDAGSARSQLQCLVKLEEWELAEQVVAALDPGVAAENSVRKLVEQVGAAAAAGRSEEATAAVETETASPATASVEPAAAEAVAAATEVAEAPTDRQLAQLTRAEKALGRAKKAGKLRGHLERVEEIAEQLPDEVTIQLLAARLAYRVSEWEKAVHYFRRSGEIGEDQPAILFYFAVSLYESNDPGAATVLQRALPYLQETPVVLEYRRRILGDRG